MFAAAAVAELIAVVASWPHVEQSAGRAAVRVVVYREHSASGIETESKRIPKPSGQPFELCPVAGAPKETSALATTVPR